MLQDTHNNSIMGYKSSQVGETTTVKRVYSL